MIIFVPVVDASLRFPVPKAKLHSSRDINGQTALELHSGPQTRLQRDHLRDRQKEKCDHMDANFEEWVRVKFFKVQKVVLMMEELFQA